MDEDDLEIITDEVEEEVEEEEVEEEEEEEEEEEDKEDIEEPEDEEEVDDIEDMEEPEDEIVENVENEEDGGSIGDYMFEEGFTTKSKKRLRSIQRFYKTTKDIQPRKIECFEQPSVYLMEQLLASCTTQNNAALFSEVCKANAKDLYQLCGKLIQKEFAFCDLYKEVENGVDSWQSKTFAREQEREKQDIQVMTVKLSVTEGLYQCSRCKSQKTFSRQVQTRSADEGMTSIIQCSECNKVWKEYA
jgi:DNA-directed RNA polymerase subunit M/transcription elongation factor TFIIS